MSSQAIEYVQPSHLVTSPTPAPSATPLPAYTSTYAAPPSAQSLPQKMAYQQPQQPMAQTFPQQQFQQQQPVFQQQQQQQQDIYPQQQQQIPQQQQLAQQQFVPQQFPPQQQQQLRTAVPIAALSRSAVPIDCPSCGQRAVTVISYRSGDNTHMWALVFCFFLLAPCVPYLIKNFKDVQHNCGNCGVPVALWHKSGGVDILII